MPDMAWRVDLGETAVAAHTDAILNGQETEPFETQARDVLVNVLHAMRENWDGEDGEFDADKILTTTLVLYNSEVEEAEEEE